MFKNAQMNDRVWDSRYGWGTVRAIYPKNVYPVKVEFDFRLLKKDYSFDGKSSLEYTYQVLFWNEFKVPIEAFVKPLPKLEKDTKVLVWDDNNLSKRKRYFSHFSKEGTIYCYEQGCTSWTGTTSQEWDYWELYNENIS